MAFTHHQTIDPRGCVQSIQALSVPVPAESGADPAAAAREAGRLYFRCLARWGRPLLKVQTHPDGSAELRALGILLLAFESPVVATDPAGGRWQMIYPIDRGWAVQPGREGRGSLSMSFAPGQVRLAVEGYFARMVGPRRNPLRVWAYRFTQSALHLLIARRYLPVLARHLTAAQKG